MAADPQLLLKKSSMLPPSLLLEEGVPVSRVVQRPGQFVVTLPQAHRATEPEPKPNPNPNPNPEPEPEP